MEANLRRESLTYDDRTISLVTHEPFMKNKILFMFALVALFGGSTLADTHSLAKPNVVYIMADDIDWGDLSTHGGGEPTPNIDRLFARGVELRHFMGWCVCSPTRAMLLTGRHPIRVGTGPEVGGELDPAQTTIAEGFKSNGYRTCVLRQVAPRYEVGREKQQ